MKADTPIIKAEQFVHTLANGQYFFEVLIWMGLSSFVSIMIWVLLKKTIFSKKKFATQKGYSCSTYFNNKN